MYKKIKIKIKKHEEPKELQNRENCIPKNKASKTQQ